MLISVLEKSNIGIRSGWLLSAGGQLSVNVSFGARLAEGISLKGHKKRVDVSRG